MNGSSAKATQRRKRFAFFPCPEDGTKSLHQEQKTESGTISFLQLGQFIRTPGSDWEAETRDSRPPALRRDCPRLRRARLLRSNWRPEIGRGASSGVAG